MAHMMGGSSEGEREGGTVVKILIVEDDRVLNDGIALSLSSEETVQAFCLREAREMLDGKIDLIILDINLPDGSGLDFCKEVREKNGTPVIFLTANDLEIDIVTGLESGADDYITKPFSLAVLRARVNAVLRRNQAPKPASEGGNAKGISAENVFCQDGFYFDFSAMTFSVDGRSVELSKTEQKLLRLLVDHQGVTLSRDMLIDRIWSDGAEFVESNALSVAVSRLREKLPGVPVRTVYGIGYVWEK